jgi:hypothetical protein
VKDRLGLIIGIVIGLYGLYRVDYILYLGLNYFGKYIFFVIFNLFVLYSFWFLHKKTKGVWKNLAPLLFGIVLLIFGLSL